MHSKILVFGLLMAFTLTFQSCTEDDVNGNNITVWACGDNITDVDGNTYNTVRIGNQCWTVQNLKASNYNDQTPIANVTDQTEWSTLSTGAWAFYDNDASNDDIHGKLYNWFAVDTEKLCPEGWHVPSEVEWNSIINTLGGITNAGPAMKSTENWNNSSNYATNSSGLTLVPSGNRDINYGSLGLGETLWIHSTTEDPNNNMFSVRVKVTSNGNTSFDTYYKEDGLPCRCVLD